MTPLAGWRYSAPSFPTRSTSRSGSPGCRLRAAGTAPVWSSTPTTCCSPTTCPNSELLADGYTARTIDSDDDWEALVALDLADNAHTHAHEPVGYERFLRDQARARRRMTEAGVARWFGAHAAADGALAASLGIVVCDNLARFQSVGTSAAHRRRGLAGHLLGLAARWAGDGGATAWVIVTESANPAGRLYRSVGFVPDVVQVAASHQ